MAQATSISYAVGTITLSGKVSAEGGVFHVAHKKPRSSKMLFDVIPAAAVAAAVCGDEGYIVVRQGSEEYVGLGSDTQLDPETGLIQTTLEDGTTAYIDPALLRATADLDEEAAAPKKKAKAKPEAEAPAKKKVKSKA